MLRMKKMDNNAGKSWRVTLLRLLHFEVGMHDINGMHLSAGFGIGPIEMSFTLHQWDKW